MKRAVFTYSLHSFRAYIISLRYTNDSQKIIMPLCGLLKGGFDHDRRDLESGIYTEPRAVLA